MKRRVRPTTPRSARGPEGKKLPLIDFGMLGRSLSRRTRTLDARQARDTAIVEAEITELAFRLSGEAAFQQGRKSGQRELAETALTAVDGAFDAGARSMLTVFDHHWAEPLPVGPDGEPAVHRTPAEVFAEADRTLAERAGEGAIQPGYGDPSEGYGSIERRIV